MGRAIYCEKGVWAGDQLQRGFDLRDRAKRVARAVDEERGRYELREMLGAQLRRSFRRMQRIRQEQQTVNQLRLFRYEHSGLPPTVGVAAKKRASRDFRSHDRDCSTETFAVSLGTAGARRSKRASEAKGQVEAQHREAAGGERGGHFDQKLSLAIRASAMREHDAVAIGFSRLVEESADGGFGGLVNEWRGHEKTVAE